MSRAFGEKGTGARRHGAKACATGSSLDGCCCPPALRSWKLRLGRLRPLVASSGAARGPMEAVQLRASPMATTTASDVRGRGADGIPSAQNKRIFAANTLKIPVWWRRAVLPSLPWVVCFQKKMGTVLVQVGTLSSSHPSFGLSVFFLFFLGTGHSHPSLACLFSFFLSLH